MEGVWAISLVYLCWSMRKLRWLSLLMGFAIIGITGFQFFWISQNYVREKKALELKTEALFRQTVSQLQAAKLKLIFVGSDSTGKHPSQHGNVKIMIRETGPVQKTESLPGEQLVTTINMIGDNVKDSLKKGMMISMDKRVSHFTVDSLHFEGELPPPTPGDRMIQLLYGVDSLRDSIRVAEADSALKLAFAKQKITAPFTIRRFDNKKDVPASGCNIGIGLARPITYNMSLANSFPYLLKQITLPILFSVLLLGITFLSFVLLYRNLVKQQRLAALKNEFISNITHELKTPIATVGVAIEALKNFNAMQDPQRTREYLDISSNELQRLSLLVDKVLKLSMFEKKEIELRPEPVNLLSLAEEVAASLKLQLEKRGAVVQISSKGDTTISGDKLHLLSVLFNLVDNALKYSNTAPHVDIKLKETSHEVIVEVADNGIGIPPEYRDKIFEKFFRVPHGDTHDAKGYGLGLSYAAQVIQRHGGSISLAENEGGGTRFTIHLPKQPIL